MGPVAAQQKEAIQIECLLKNPDKDILKHLFI